MSKSQAFVWMVIVSNEQVAPSMAACATSVWVHAGLCWKALWLVNKTRKALLYIQEVKSVYCWYTEKPSWILKSALVRLFRHSTLGVVLTEIFNWEQIECAIIIGQTQTTYTRESIIIAPCSAGTGETNQQSPRQRNNTGWKCEAKYDTRRHETLQNETGSS